MPNMLMMRYAGSLGNKNRNEMLGNESRNEMRQGGNRNEMNGNMGGEMRGGNQNANNRGMAYGAMENRGEYDGGAESRYRGRDGRWRAGTRRSEYEDGTRNEADHWPESRYQEDRYTPHEGRGYDRRRAGDDDDEKEQEYKVRIAPSDNVIEWPYGSPDAGNRPERSGRQIGFGAMNNMESRMEHGGEHQMGRSDPGMEPMEFTRETAEHWVRSMQNEDKQHPVGGKWSADMLKPLAQKYGIPTEGKRFWEFYAMTNAMYSDYGEVARKFGITSPEFYVCMAKAWMNDKDAEKDKTALYYEYIVKK